MKFHIWRPEKTRWIVIDTSDGALYDVTQHKNHFTINGGYVTDYAMIRRVVETYEKQCAASLACGHNCTHDFEVK